MSSLTNPWIPPDLSGRTLQYRVTSRMVEEFVRGHTPSDVLRELVQNEYDAGGDRLGVEFGRTFVEVNGTGRRIDEAGWKRLSVMMGTGHVAGTDDKVQEKINDLGSKNFGLRALFLFGDRIYIGSGGLQTVLDVHQGTLPKPVADPRSKRSKGVRIIVPYRQKASDLLEPFDLGREERAFADFVEHLAPTMIKLVQPGAQKSIRTVAIASQRLGRHALWRQEVKALRSTCPKVSLAHRVARGRSMPPAM
jgi:hypothetical protein